MIKHFKIYNVDNKSIGKRKPYNIMRLMEKFDLKKEIDKKMAYKITEDETEVPASPSIIPKRYRHSTYAHLI